MNLELRRNLLLPVMPKDGVVALDTYVVLSSVLDLLLHSLLPPAAFTAGICTGVCTLCGTAVVKIFDGLTSLWFSLTLQISGPQSAFGLATL